MIDVGAQHVVPVQLKKMSKEIKIGLIGFGTVGQGVVSVLNDNAGLISSRCGLDLKIAGIADIDVKKKVNAQIDPSILTDDAYKLINDPTISVIVEAIGGVDPAFKFIMDSIGKSKHVVTSNKEVIAKKGLELIKAAEKKGVNLLFEGAVAGGIPILAALRNSLSGNKIEQVYGIVNGTTNFILSKMTNEGMEFSQALKEAQRLGYAEADPKNDIEGYDASFKAAILGSVAFGSWVKWEDVQFEGISSVALEDIKYAQELGYVVKLLAVAKDLAGKVQVRVHPCLIDKGHPLSTVSDSYNAVYIKGNVAGEQMYYGLGAGGKPTASAIISDVIEASLCGCDCSMEFKGTAAMAETKDSENSFYVRLMAGDMPGVLAAIAKAFGDSKVSIRSALQKETVDNVATIVIITHKVKEKNFSDAMASIAKLPAISKVGSVIRVGME